MNEERWLDQRSFFISLFGLRRLDAALTAGGLTAQSPPQRLILSFRNRQGNLKSGVEPPQSK